MRDLTFYLLSILFYTSPLFFHLHPKASTNSKEKKTAETRKKWNYNSKMGQTLNSYVGKKMKKIGIEIFCSTFICSKILKTVLCLQNSNVLSEMAIVSTFSKFFKLSILFVQFTRLTKFHHIIQTFCTIDFCLYEHFLLGKFGQKYQKRVNIVNGFHFFHGRPINDD